MRDIKNRTNNGTDLAYISPSVLAWAIKRSNLTHEVVADKINATVEQIQDWEQDGGSSPPFSKAQALAKALHIPFGFFYLESPPSDALPLPDFRGFDHSKDASDNLLDLVNDVLVKQDWYRDHVREGVTKQLDFVGRFGVHDSIVDVSASIRRSIGISQRLRQSVSSWSEYLATLTRQSEDAGVLVMRSGVVGNITNRKLSVEELQGFAMADPFAPIVFVNSADYRASQIFTLAHELAHIWIGQSAIADANELDEGTDRIESFCNRVATETLVPREEFLTAWRYDAGTPEARVGHLARQFWVSSFVTLRRAHELAQITEEQYRSIKRQEQNRRKIAKSSGGDYYRNVLARMSAKFTNAVLADVNRETLPLRDAARLLGMKVPTLVKFAETWK